MATLRPQLDKEQLTELRKLWDAVNLARAEHAAAQANFDLALARQFAEKNVIQASSSICLHCGAFVPRGVVCTCQADG
jgi:hypothetical protein